MSKRAAQAAVAQAEREIIELVVKGFQPNYDFIEVVSEKRVALLNARKALVDLEGEGSLG